MGFKIEFPDERRSLCAQVLALLVSLNKTEVEDTIRAWQAVQAVREGGRIVKASQDLETDNEDQAEEVPLEVQPEPWTGWSGQAQTDPAPVFVPSMFAPMAEPMTVTVTHEDEAKVEDLKATKRALVEPATDGSYTYGGYAFSPRRRGPHSALQRALKDIQDCQNPTGLEDLETPLTGLSAWLKAVGQPDKAEALGEAYQARTEALTTAAPAAVEPAAPWVEPVIEPTPQAASTPKGNGAEPEVPIRALLSHSMKRLGRMAVVAIMKQHGVATLDSIPAEAEVGIRADVAVALAEAG